MSAEPIFCAETVAAAHNDDVRYECGSEAVEECFTVNGRWEPLCERHAAMYRPTRVRPLGDKP